MIDAASLANQVFSEARIIASRTYWDDRTEPTDVKFSRLLVEAPLPPPEMLASVLSEAFWASLLAEEGRPCRPRLVFGREPHGTRPVHVLRRPKALTREALRKLSPAHGAKGYLRWDCGSGVAEINALQGYDGLLNSLVIAVVGPGALDVIWNRTRVLTLRSGTARTYSECAYHEYGEATSRMSTVMGEEFGLLILSNVIWHIQDTGHGGSLWVVKEGASLEGLKIGHEVQRDEVSILSKTTEWERQAGPWLTALANLAAVDGAVLLDAKVNVLGFGAFVDEVEPVALERLMFDGSTQPLSSATLGGGRHRSAAAFCKRFAPACAVVVSSDGVTSVITAGGPSEAPLCSEVVPLGFAMH